MPRVRRGFKRRHRRRKILRLASGFWGAKSRLYKSAKEAVERSLSFAYRDRRTKKRQFRRLWITRIGAAARSHEMSYGTFMAGLRTAGVDLNRKSLAEMAVADPQGFEKLASMARESLSG